MKIKTKTDTAIAEIGASTEYTDREGQEILKKEFEKRLEENIVRVVKKVQDEYNTDILGFGNAVHRNMPGLWDRLKSQWETEFPKVEVDVTSEIVLRNSAHSNKAIKKGG